MNEQADLPLFPLKMVLFPTCRIPLNIFEERYKLMVNECLEQESEFVIVSGTDDMFQSVGCAARVTDLVKRHDDGRMSIIVIGTRRVQVLDRMDKHAYISATVRTVPDELEASDEELVNRVRHLYDDAIKLSFGWLRPSGNEELEPSELSFAIATGVNMELDDQQDFLEVRYPNERLRRAEKMLRGAVEGIKEVKRRTGGNGHLE